MSEGPPDRRRRKWLLLGLMTGAALVNRSIIALWTTSIAADGGTYLEVARIFGAGDSQGAIESTHQIFPLYPGLVAALATIIGNYEAAGYVIPILASTLAMLPLFFVIEMLWNERIAWWSCFLYALHPLLALECSEVRSVGLFVGLYVASMSFGLLALNGRHWLHYPASGLSLGLCYLTRPEALSALLLLGVATVVAAVRLRAARTAEAAGTDRPLARQLSWIRFGAGIMAALIAFALVGGTFIIWIRCYTGSWKLTHRRTGITLWKDLVGPPSAAPAPAPASRQPSAPSPSPALPPRAETKPAPPVSKPVEPPVPSPSPSPVPRAETKPAPPDPVPPVSKPPAPPVPSPSPLPDEHAGSRRPSPIAMMKYFERALYWPLTPFLLLGVFGCRRQGGRWSLVLVLGTTALIIMVPAFLRFALRPEFRPSARHLLPGIILLLPCIACGILVAYEMLQKVLRPSWSGRIAAAYPWLLAGCIGTLLLAHSLGPRRPDEQSFIEAGAWLRQRPAPSREPVRSIALVSSEKLSYYAGERALSIPECDGESRMVRDGREWRRCTKDEPGSVCYCVGRTTQMFKDYRVTYLLIHSGAIRKYHPTFVEDLKKQGFVQTMAFTGSGKPGVQTVWVYERNP